MAATAGASVATEVTDPEHALRWPADAFLTDAGIANLMGQTTSWLARFALWNYHVGNHAVPNVYTPAGNLRDQHSANGSRGRVRKFVQRETDPERVMPQSAAISIAQSAMMVGVISHGADELEVALLAVLVARGSGRAQLPTQLEVREDGIARLASAHTTLRGARRTRPPPTD